MADIIVEAVMVEMKRIINFLMKVVDERYHEIADVKDHTRTHKTTKSS